MRFTCEIVGRVPHWVRALPRERSVNVNVRDTHAHTHACITHTHTHLSHTHTHIYHTHTPTTQTHSHTYQTYTAHVMTSPNRSLSPPLPVFPILSLPLPTPIIPHVTTLDATLLTPFRPVSPYPPSPSHL